MNRYPGPPSNVTVGGVLIKWIGWGIDTLLTEIRMRDRGEGTNQADGCGCLSYVHWKQSSVTMLTSKNNAANKKLRDEMKTREAHRIRLKTATNKLTIK